MGQADLDLREIIKKKNKWGVNNWYMLKDIKDGKRKHLYQVEFMSNANISKRELQLIKFRPHPLLISISLRPWSLYSKEISKLRCIYIYIYIYKYY